ncbi:right-handed parallel beta-helix repeat-containing protein [Natronosalvus vescus]|uniref:right-handed parallel beta-helix repeat-containing protein n=1 Tax=Natronosalvus vescus TaxID=2953881 RepID=UPI00209066A4|nr:right-handed parallel beta-helix repeat-containing protein [Natronosalvus vescus]
MTLDGAGYTIDGYPVSEDEEDVSDTRGILVRNESHVGLGWSDSDGWLSDITIRNTNFEYWDQSVRVVGASDVTIEDIVSRYDEQYPHGNYADIHVRYGGEIEISSVEATEEQIGRAIYVDSVSTATIQGVMVERDRHGTNPMIDVQDSSDVTVSETVLDDTVAINSMSALSTSGIGVKNTDGVTITNNQLIGIGSTTDDDLDRHGIYFDGQVTDAHVEGNEIIGGEDLAGGSEVGITANSADGIVLTNNEIETWSGIELLGGDSATITGNDIREGSRDGIRLSDSTNSAVSDNDIHMESGTGIEIIDSSPEVVENIDIQVDGPGVSIYLLANDNDPDEFFHLSDLSISGGGIEIDRRNNLQISETTIEDGRLEYSGPFGDFDQNVSIVDVEIRDYPGFGATVELERATGVTIENVSSKGGMKQGLQIGQSSEVSVDGFTITDHGGEDDFAFVTLEDSDNVSIDKLNVSHNPATVEDGSSREKGLLYLGETFLGDGNEDIQISNLSVIDNNIEAPALKIEDSRNVSLFDVAMSSLDSDFAEIHDTSSDVQGTNVTLGLDAPTEVTFSFEGAGIDLGEADSPPANQDADSIEQYLRVEPDEWADEPYLDLSFHYTDDDVSSVEEDSLDVWHYASWASWTTTPDSTVEPDQNTVSVSLSEFPDDLDDTRPVFGAFAGASAELQVTSASINKSEIEVDEPVAVTAEVENTGDATGTHTAELEIDGNVEATETVSIDAGDTEEITFTHTFDDAGEFDVRVDDVDAGTVTVEEAELDFGGLRVTVTDATGDPIEGAGVWVVPLSEPTEGEPDGTTNETGVYEEDSPASTWDVVVDADGYETERIENVEVVAEEWTTVDVELHQVEAPQPVVTVIDATLSEADVDEGEAVTITATLENTGDATGTHTAELEIDGTVEDDETVEVEAGETEEIAFTHTFDDAGEFDVRVDSVEAGTVTVSEADESTSSPSPSPSPSPTPDPDPEPAVTVEPITNGTAVSVTDAIANETVSIPIADELEGSDSHLAWLNVTTTVDGDYEATIRTSDELPDDVTELPADPALLEPLQITTSLESEEIENATLEFVVPADELDARGLEPEDVTLYHYDDGEWIEHDTESVFPGDTWNVEEIGDSEVRFPGGMWDVADVGDTEVLYPGGMWDVEEVDGDVVLYPGGMWDREEMEGREELFPGGMWEVVEIGDTEVLYPGGMWDADEADDVEELFPGGTWEVAEIGDTEVLYPGDMWSVEEVEAGMVLFPGGTWNVEDSDVEDVDDLDELFPGGMWEVADVGDTEVLYPGGMWNLEKVDDRAVVFPGGMWTVEEVGNAGILYPGGMWDVAEVYDRAVLFPGGTWEITYRAETPHFSAFALAGDRPHLEVVDSSVSPSELSVGEEATIEATVRNDGRAAGEIDLDLAVDGTVEETKTVTLEPGDERVVAFGQAFDEPGEFEVTVADLEAGSVTVEADVDEEATDETDRDEAVADDDTSDEGTTDEETTDETDTDEGSADETVADGTPGFGVLAAVGAVLAVLGALSIRSRS